MKKENIIFYCGFGLISVFLIIMMAYFSRGCGFIGDDFWFAMLRPYDTVFSPLNPFSNIHGNGYFGYWILTFFVYSLPNYFLNLNPGDIITIPHGIFRGFLVVITLSSLLLFFKQFYRGKIFYLILYLTIASFFFFLGLTSNVILINYNFYRYFFSIFFGVVFWLYLYKHSIIKYKKINIPELILVCFCAYVIGTASEIEIYLSLALICSMIGWNILLKFLKVLQPLKLNLNLIYPILFFLGGMLLFTSSSGYKSVAFDRGMNNINLNFPIIKEFSIVYFQNCFIKEWFLWVIIIVFAIFAFYFASRKNEYKKLIFPVLFILSLLSVMYSLILCGKTYEANNYFYITHDNVLTLYYLLLLIPALIFTGYSLKNIKSKKIKCIAALILLTTSCFMTIKAEYIRPYYFYLLHKKNYIIEKIALYENYKSSKICLPKDTVLDFKYEIVQNEYGLFMYKNYLNQTYHIENINETPFEFTNNAIEQFYDIGGNFGKKEIKKLKFQNLNNPYFVLKKQDDELSKEEILEILRQ